MKISFIIPAHNEKEYIIPCLESIYNLEGLSDFEVMVVDNLSTDRTSDVVREKFPQVQLLIELEKGTNFARQKGFKNASGELLAFFDADIVAPKWWYKKITSRFGNEKDLIALSGPYIYTDIAPPFGLTTNKIYNFILGPGINWFFMKTRRTALFFGGNMVVKRDALQRIGGFDTNYTFHGDDTNLGRRLAHIGKVKFISTIWVYASSRRFKKHGTWRMFYRYTMNFLWEALFHKPFSK